MTYLPFLLPDAEMSSEVPGTVACGTDQKHIHRNKTIPYLGKGLQVPI